MTTWKQYKEFVAHHERLNKPVRNFFPAVIGLPDSAVQTKDQPNPEPVARMPSESGDSGVPGQSGNEPEAVAGAEDTVMKSKDFVDNGETHPPATPPAGSSNNNNNNAKEPRTRKTSKSIEPFDQAEREEMEHLLHELRGHLGERILELLLDQYLLLSVLYPLRFLEGEDIANNFLFNADRYVPHAQAVLTFINLPAQAVAVAYL